MIELGDWAANDAGSADLLGVSLAQIRENSTGENHGRSERD
jgi:hypothetical protein